MERDVPLDEFEVVKTLKIKDDTKVELVRYAKDDKLYVLKTLTR